MISALLTAAATLAPLPQHVGSPQPGEFTVAIGFEGRLPAFDLRMPVADWVRLDVELNLHRSAPLLASEVTFAADTPRPGLNAHAFMGLGLRPAFDGSVLSGAQVLSGVGVVGVWGAFVAAAEGGTAIGLSFNRADVTNIDPLAVDQQGGLFALQRLTLGYDLFDRLQLAMRLVFALPLDAIALDQAQDDAFPESEFRLGGRLAIRF